MAETLAPDDPLNIALPTATTSHTRWFLVVFYAVSVAWGVRNAWYWIPSKLDVLIALLFVLCLGSWARVDTRRRKRPLPPLSLVWFFAFAVVLVPGYVVSSRGWRGVGWILLNAFCSYLLATVAMHACGTLVFGEDWWLAMGAWQVD